MNNEMDFGTDEEAKKTATVIYTGSLTPDAARQITDDTIAAAYLKPEVIVLVLDCAGGTSSPELNELEELIYQLRSRVLTICICNGSLFSAGYMLGSAFSKIYTATRAARFGSIGYYIRVDKETLGKDLRSLVVFRSGIYKAAHLIDSPEENELVKAQHKHELSTILDVMIEQVAERRGLSTEQVKALADGRTFSADEAIACGLIDGYYSVPDWILHQQIKER